MTSRCRRGDLPVLNRTHGFSRQLKCLKRKLNVKQSSCEYHLILALIWPDRESNHSLSFQQPDAQSIRLLLSIAQATQQSKDLFWRLKHLSNLPLITYIDLSLGHLLIASN